MQDWTQATQILISHRHDIIRVTIQGMADSYKSLIMVFVGSSLALLLIIIIF